MKKELKKEVKIGILLFAVFNILNLIFNEIVAEMPALHFFLGGLVGLSLAMIIIGILPEMVYIKLKDFKINLLNNKE